MEVVKNILWRNWLGLLIAVILAIFLFKSCENNKRLENNYKAANSKMISYESALGTQTAVQKVQELTINELRQTMSDTVAKLTKKFSKINSITEVKTITKIDTVKVSFKEPVPCAFVREGSEAQRWYSFKYKVTDKGFEIDSLKIPNQLIVATGLQRKWFLGKTTLTTEVTNTNQNIKTTDLKTFQTTVSKKWYENVFIWLGAGAIGGYLIAKK